MDFARFQHISIKSQDDQEQETVFISNDGRNLQMEEIEYDFVPVQSADRVLILDDNGVLREAYADMSYLLSHGVTVAEDTEIPPYVLDHMYAKKPREPGSEQAPVKPRRRAKRKEQVVEQFVISDTQPPAPKINIIRQRLPTGGVSSLSSRPKILHGGHQKSPINSGLIDSLQSISPTKGKTSPSKYNAVHQGRSTKKEEPVKTTYSSYDELSKYFTSKNLFGSSNKFGKDSNKSQKSSLSKSTASAIMDDLQRDGAPYEDEMLFDFGIAEDDEGIVSTLGADGFSDGEFDEFGGMEVYTNSVQSGLKASSLSKSPVITSGVLLNQRPLLRTTTHPQLPSEISDDDDSNQIMVSMSNRRPSQDWDSVQLFDSPIKQEQYQESNICNPESSLSISAADKDAKIILSDKFSLQSDLKLTVNSLKSKTVQSDDDKFSLSSDINKPKEGDSFLSLLSVNGSLLKEDSFMDSSSSCTNNNNETTSKSSSTKILSPTRRSSRVIKTPAWLEEVSTIPVKRRRK